MEVKELDTGKEFLAPEIANIPAEFNGSIAKSTSTAPSIEVPEIVLEILKELPVTEGAAPYLEVKVLLDEPEPMLRLNFYRSFYRSKIFQSYR